ncbi:hypothetical protein O181_069572 [Austropuccinia psidii MF-1]|uniref:Uncharacterized protein n=1 Tax=Austropuccinia psidii MF-1 TaxID=1389203 RepID=A0A9Q3I7F1_9BASI|nr:hypothetical protein [Austropuccinia psidii MF-1]
MSRTRSPGRGHLGHSGHWQDIEGNYTHSAIQFSIQQKPQTRGLEGYGSSSSAPPTPQRPFSMEHGQQKAQPSIPLGSTGSKFLQDMFQRDRLKRPYCNQKRRSTDPDRAYSHSFRLTKSRPNQLYSSFTSFRNQHISGKESPLFTIPGSFQEKTRIQGQKQDLLQPKAERFRTNDPEDFGLCERSKQKPEIVVNTSRISSFTSRKITPTQTEHNVVTPESNINSDKLWLQMSQLSVQTQESLDDLKSLNEILQRNAILQEATTKAIQESCAQLNKASEETNKRLNQVFEEKHPCKKDRDCPDQDINKFFDVNQNITP